MRKDLEDRIDNILQDERAASTIKTYQSGIKYFWKWAEISKSLKEEYPISRELVLEFLVDHVYGLPDGIDRKMIECGIKKTTGRHKISAINLKLRAISYAHTERGFIEEDDDPCDSKKIRKILSAGKRKEVKRGISKNQKRAIIKSTLEKMIKKINLKTIKGKRDRALLEFIFYTGGRRRSEAANARYKYLKSVKGGYEYFLHCSKTDQSGKGSKKLLVGEPSKSMTAYLKTSGIQDGYLFRKIKNGIVTNNPISGHDINKIVKDLVEEIRLDPKDYGGHSLRRGFCTECGIQKVPILEAMKCSGHVKVETFLIYYEEGDLYLNSATKL